MIDRIRQLEATLDIVLDLDTISERMAKNPRGFMLVCDTEFSRFGESPAQKQSLFGLLPARRRESRPKRNLPSAR